MTLFSARLYVGEIKISFLIRGIRKAALQGLYDRVQSKLQNGIHLLPGIPLDLDQPVDVPGV